MLKITNLRKSFRSKEVLKDVSFEVKKGEIVRLLGNNGAGKTTIINCILKMLKPDSGEIELDGKAIDKCKNSEYFNKVSALLESSTNVYDYLTGRQNIKYFASLSNIDSKSEDIEKYIDDFELREAIDKPVGEYSRGMQQKPALIISLMQSPKLLLLDEPTLGLDIKSKNSVIDNLNRLIKEKGMAVILTTHQMEVVQKLSGRVLILKYGVVKDFPETVNDKNQIYIVW
ncbi:putative sodium extrusion ABC transporter, ATP-binding protein NatA [Catonella morbi ATCC 51271]|uniref:Putative sodium extrusion ABC transporter, ATP-binding protein NatA n=1 Tax=Catonella morbi ATCC 51271 TaxID=592026 RepID=V2XPX2_9FIRM|nr:ABC transporter ATP-binding protein [Catonella morbi]ESL04214.1 putative sodium extrusion ABC transporter, ATP-binding protein NatA [Catonella morbi ATCC 51271]